MIFKIFVCCINIMYLTAFYLWAKSHITIFVMQLTRWIVKAALRIYIKHFHLYSTYHNPRIPNIHWQWNTIFNELINFEAITQTFTKWLILSIKCFMIQNFNNIWQNGWAVGVDLMCLIWTNDIKSSWGEGTEIRKLNIKISSKGQKTLV